MATFFFSENAKVKKLKSLSLAKNDAEFETSKTSGELDALLGEQKRWQLWRCMFNKLLLIKPTERRWRDGYKVLKWKFSSHKLNFVFVFIDTKYNKGFIRVECNSSVYFYYFVACMLNSWNSNIPWTFGDCWRKLFWILFF